MVVGVVDVVVVGVAVVCVVIVGIQVFRRFSYWRRSCQC